MKISRYWPLTLILLMFITPALAALYVLSFKDLSQFNTVNHGRLIEPAQQLNSRDLTPHKWHLIYLNPKSCATVCQDRQQQLSKLHVALGADRDRVIISSSDNDRLSTGEKDDSILIIDPMGFYIMHYAPQAKLNGLLKDLKRLLKYSHAT